MPLPSLEHLTSLALEAANAAAHVLIDHLRDENDELVIRAKRDGTLVSAVDIESHRTIEGILAPSGIPIISEEGELPPFSIRSKWPLFWLVDPLDGTESYLAHRSGFAVNIALCDLSGPILGVIADPISRAIFGGSIEAKPFKVELDDWRSPSTIQPLPIQKPYTLVTSWNEPLTKLELLPVAFRELDVTVHPVSGALKFCQIVTGHADIHVRSGSYMEWDCAAGDAIVRSAGMSVLSRDDDQPLRYNSLSLRVGGLWVTRLPMDQR